MHGAAFGTLFSMTDVLFGTLVMRAVDRYGAGPAPVPSVRQPGRRGSYLEVEVG